MDRQSVSDDRFVLSFYGIEASPYAAERFFELSREWFTALGYDPDFLSVRGGGSQGRLRSFKRRAERLESAGFSSVEAFEIKASLLGAKYPGSEYSAGASFSRLAKPGHFAILAVPSSVLTKDNWEPIAIRAIECVRPAYGIAFERTLMNGPIWYALGVNFGRPDDRPPIGDEYDRTRSISRWSSIGMPNEVYREGLLRYVYRWNFLTRPQLDREIEGVSLAEWIQADPRRGTLAQFADDVWLWEVENGELDWIRDQLHDANAIFDWRRYCNVEPHIKTVLG